MKKLPVVEKFVSIQGEGFWSGAPMWFIRLGGCVVGQSGSIEGSGMGYDTCTLPNGYMFRCDTAFASKELIPVEELVAWVPERVRVCITGGEPIVYDLTELVHCLNEKDVQVHIETSGVGEWQEWMNDCWVTVSPKQGYNKEVVNQVNEVKWLVSEKCKLGLEELYQLQKWSEEKWVFLQPIMDVLDYEENLKYAIEVCKENPLFRLSVQLHKVIGVR